MLIGGRCHCGNISFRLDWQPEPMEIPARSCSCSFCAKHGGVWTSCPAGALEVSVNAFENIAPSLLRPAAASYDGEMAGDRLARRAHNWIGDVRFVQSGARQLPE